MISASRSIDETLSKTGLQYLDMMIIHSPQPWMEVNQSSNRYFAGKPRGLAGPGGRGRAAGKVRTDRRIQLPAGGPRKYPRRLQNQAGGEPGAVPYLQYAACPDGVLPLTGDRGGGLFPGRARRRAEGPENQASLPRNTMSPSRSSAYGMTGSSGPSSCPRPRIRST
jgi:hypothetical protein